MKQEILLWNIKKGLELERKSGYVSINCKFLNGSFCIVCTLPLSKRNDWNEIFKKYNLQLHQNV